MTQVRVGYLPPSFFGAGTFSARVFQGRERFYIPPDPVMFHANFTVGVNDKVARLAEAQRIVAQGEWRRRLNSVLFQLQARALPSRAAALAGQGGIAAYQPAHRDVIDHSDYIRPRSVALDASTACQLKCPSCPTATGAIARSIGAGFLTVANFEKFLREHPWVSDVELSNWGEVFLNPDLEEILRLGRERRVTLRIDNGANLDRASDRVLEAVVKYKLSSLSVSIDGASQQVYATYRVRGDFDRVISHVRRIVALKKQHRSRLPLLRWQFVAFGHNQHEIPKAREMARDLGMEFHVKLSWDDLYTPAFSPVSDRKSIEKETGLGVADRQEYEEIFGRSYIAATCHQLWLRPRINYDGRLLGCSINHWDDFGNVFADGMEASLHSERMRSTKEALMGYREMDEASPCRRCQVYRSMRRNGAWVRPEDLTPATSGNGLTRWASAPARVARRYARLFKRVRGGYTPHAR
jgi:MoaA/NifB/PqqE/SkfB family radical SAM enzyme